MKNRIGIALRNCAQALANSDSYLGARYRYLQRRLPAKKAATKAMARYLACLIYDLLTKGRQWVDRGAAMFRQKRAQWDLAGLKARAQAQGFALVPLPPAN